MPANMTRNPMPPAQFFESMRFEVAKQEDGTLSYGTRPGVTRRAQSRKAALRNDLAQLRPGCSLAVRVFFIANALPGGVRLEPHDLCGGPRLRHLAHGFLVGNATWRPRIAARVAEKGWARYAPRYALRFLQTLLASVTH